MVYRYTNHVPLGQDLYQYNGDIIGIELIKHRVKYMIRT